MNSLKLLVMIFMVCFVAGTTSCGGESPYDHNYTIKISSPGDNRIQYWMSDYTIEELDDGSREIIGTSNRGNHVESNIPVGWAIIIIEIK